MFFGKLLPREGNFFEMFNQHADRIVEAAHAFAKLVANYSDPHLRDKYNQEVDNAERAAARCQQGDPHHVHHAYRPGADSFLDQHDGRYCRSDPGFG